MAFATASELESYMGVTFDATESLRAQDMLDLATALIQRRTRQTLEQVTDETITVDATGTPRIYLPQRPVTAISEVTLAGEVVDPASYVFDSEGVLTRIDAFWSTPWSGPTWGETLQSIEVTYTHGYATIPDDLKLACLELARRGMAIGADGTVVRSQSLDNYSTTFAVGEEAVRASMVDVDAIIGSYGPTAFG